MASLNSILLLILLSLLTSFPHPSLSLSPDGTLLLAFRYSILSDPLSLLLTWNYSDPSPCSWSGVTCDPTTSRVTRLSLPNSNLLGSISPDLFLLDHLQLLDLSGNSFNGSLPSSLFNSSNLTYLDLSRNQLNGSLPADIGGASLRFLNFSSNDLSGGLSPDFGKSWSENATVDLSFNNLTGEIPEVKALLAQKPEAFSGNPGLCGRPLKEICMISSTLSTAPKVSGSISPAIAVIPRSIGSDNSSNTLPATPLVGGNHAGMRPVTIVGITVADLAGIGLLGMLLMYLYRWKKNRAENAIPAAKKEPKNVDYSATPSPAATTGCCFIKGAEMEAATTNNGISSAGSDEEEEEGESGGGVGEKLEMVDGETEMEMESLMKASAYILGASGSSIVYKAVLEDGAAFAVRRLGEGGDGGGVRVKRESFEGQVKAVAKLRHPNLERVRGFYWGSTEKLVVSDYVSNGSLASISGYKKNGSSPCHLSLAHRIKIARGVARGLNYIHEKKFVHGNLKPSNILLTSEMEPIISDLGINWIINGCKGSRSGRQFGSKRSIAMAQYDMAQELSITGSPYIAPTGNANSPTSPYQPPELLKSIKISTKWDVYSFGVILLEILTGKVFFDRELGQWTPGSGIEDKYWALRMADVAIRADVQGKEEAMVGVFKLGFQCASMVPQKRPSMREAMQVLEKISVVWT